MKRKTILGGLLFVAMTLPPVLATANTLTFQGVTFETIASGNTLTLNISNALSGGTSNWANVNYLKAFEIKEVGSFTGASITSGTGFDAWSGDLAGGANKSGLGCTGGDNSGACFAASPPVALSDSMSWTIAFAGSGLSFDAPSLKVQFLTNIDDAKPTGDLLSQTIPAIPEPEIYAMMLAGLGVLGFIGRRRRKAT